MPDWGWPQWVVAALTSFGVLLAAAKHGDARPPYDLTASFLAAIITFWLLWMGGFWS